MSFCLNELQSKLRNEIEAAKDEHGGKLAKGIVLGLKLVDEMVSETYM
jgi:hypothetical protein